jgi:peptidoglycan/LPS O-acetylase OafA/YrhL
MISEVRYKNIDGLRGIAVFMVITFHFLNNSYMSSDIGQLSWFEIGIMKLTSFGWTGVNLFFVLSGFLIGSILLRYKNSPTYFRAFYVRRFIRIIPLYYIFLLFYIFFCLLINNDQIELFEKSIPLYYYFFLVQNFLFSSLGHFGPSALTPTWSLAIEEQFYLIVPFLVRYMNQERLLKFCVIFIVVAPIFRSFATNWYMEYTHLLGRIDALLLGLILAVMKSENHKYLKVVKSLFFTISIFIILFLVYFLISKSINHTLISVFFFYLVLYTFDEDNKTKRFNILQLPLFSFVGGLSFCLYLFHQLINGLIFVFFQNGSSPNLNSIQSYFLEILAVLITVILSLLSHRFLESKLISFGKKFKY